MGNEDPSNSIVWSLKRLFDPPREVEREERERRASTSRERANPGAPPLHRCRVCGYESHEASHCPDCLADTMVVVTAKNGENR